MKLRQRALRLLSPLLVTRHLSGALVRVIQATEESANRTALCSVRRLMLANSLTSLGDVRVAILEAVRARQELRQAVCQKAPGYIRARIMTSDIFTDGLMSDQTWSEVNTLPAAGSFLMPAPPSKTKGAAKHKGKGMPKPKVSSKPPSISTQASQPPASSSHETSGRTKSAPSFFKGKGRGKAPSTKEAQPESSRLSKN